MKFSGAVGVSQKEVNYSYNYLLKLKINKVIDYNYYLNLSNQLLLNYFRWGHDNFFLNFGATP